MSKKFKSQDYFRYKRLGAKWKKPKGRQSKLRKRKAGSGPFVRIGYKMPAKPAPVMVKSMKDMTGKDATVIISSSLGSRKTVLLWEKAKELGIRIANMKKVKKALKIAKGIETRKAKSVPGTESKAGKEPKAD